MNAPIGKPTLITASLSKPIVRSIDTFIRLHLGETLSHHYPKENSLHLFCIEDLYHHLDRMDSDEIFNTSCIVDLSGSEIPQWDINIEQANLRVSELVLSYPEVYFIFVTEFEPEIARNLQENVHFVTRQMLASLPVLLARHKSGFRTYFDPTGFRNLIRSRNGNSGTSSVGVTIDEEKNFLLLNGYLLYSHGYDVYIIPSLKEMEELLGTDSSLEPSLILEDIDLRFGDVNDDNARILGLSNGCESENIEDVLKRRRKKFPALENATDNVYVSTSKLTEIDGRTYTSIEKPYGGIFDKSLLKVINSRCSSVDNVRKRLFVSKGIAEKSSLGRHSAEYSSQVVAVALLTRADRIRKKASSTEQSVHGALLALDAWQLLEGKTLTLSLESLNILTELEVVAECSFFGNSQKLNVDARLKELKKLTHTALENTGNEKTKKYSRQQANAMLKISNGLRQTYKRYERFEEEEVTLNEVRKNTIILRGGCCLISNMEHYLAWLIQSMGKLLLASLGIIVIYGFVYFCMLLSNTPSLCLLSLASVFDAFYMSFIAFVALDVSVIKDSLGSQGIPIKILALSEVALGVMHLSILIAYLYQKISRR